MALHEWLRIILKILAILLIDHDVRCPESG